MANVIVVGAQWGDEGKGPPEAPHGEGGQQVSLSNRTSSGEPPWPM